MIPIAPRETPLALRRRLAIFLIGAILGLCALLTRLWVLQVIEGEEKRTLSENNRIRLHRVHATRGTVLDRNGQVVVDSRPSFDATLVPEDSHDLAATVETVAQLLNQSSAETQAILHQAKGRPAFQEVTVKRDVSWDDMMALETHQLDLPGVNLTITPRRSYPLGTNLAHLLGYVGEIDEKQLAADNRYHMGDLVGKTGLERGWEPYLRGVDGGEQIEVDAVGRKLRVLREVEEVPGNTVTLTVDLQLQAAAERALGGNDGSIVALDPNTGEILTYVNHPSYDPNTFAHGINPHQWRELMKDPHHPLANRAIQGQYPPGSTFKIVMATAALEQGVINPFTRIHCNGGVQFGGHFFRCWKKGGHGSVDLHEALVQSCDVFFYQVAQRLGIDTIARYARMFGLGMPTGIALEHEKSGIIPDTAWKKKRFNQPWYAGETLSVAIGQGYVTSTPLQMANLIATVAAGARYRPHFVKQVTTPDGEVLEQAGPERVAELSVRDTTLKQVRDGLRDVVMSDHGTGKKARVKGIEVAGKTGTSQVVKIGEVRLKAHQMPWQSRDHAWFVAYAPVDNPAIAVAAVVEHADGGGGAVAAPIVQEVLTAFFQQRDEREKHRYAQNRSQTDRPL
ncbi:MAG TPA: penicillin-binding protein 2 [Candidatus Binatia bacterium]|nr:penicillin-binding protein 2 [Candidatus Binatia bacterium]